MTTPGQARLRDAQQQLDRANAECAAERRAQDTAQLGQVRTTLRQATARLSALTTSLKQREGRIDRLRGENENLTAELTTHAQDRPELSSLLPDDPDCIAWQRRNSQLLEARRKNIERLGELNREDARERLEALRLVGSIEQLRWSERNLVQKLKGSTFTGSWEGGVSSVAAGVFNIR